MNRANAYLIVICDKQTNEILEVTVWSSPEWEQSRYLERVVTYVAWQVGGSTYADAAKSLLKSLVDPVMCRRYHWLLKYVDDDTLSNYGVARPVAEPTK